MKTSTRIALALALPLGMALGSACRLIPYSEEGSLANARVAGDYGTYQLHRVGLLPVHGNGLDPQHAEALQSAFQLELSRAAPFEIVALNVDDVAEVQVEDPHLRGWYSPRTIIELSQRFSLDGLITATVTDVQAFPPQVLGLEVDLVASETGLVIWTSSVQLDASDARVRAALERYTETLNQSTGTNESLQLTLISPARFARFAAHEVAQVL